MRRSSLSMKELGCANQARRKGAEKFLNHFIFSMGHRSDCRTWRTLRFAVEAAFDFWRRCATGPTSSAGTAGSASNRYQIFQKRRRNYKPDFGADGRRPQALPATTGFSFCRYESLSAQMTSISSGSRQAFADMKARKAY